MTPEQLAALRRRCERAFGGGEPAQVVPRIRAIVGSESAMPPTEEGRLAAEGMQALRSGEEPTPSQFAALQLLLRLTRPAPLVHGGRPDDLPTGEHVEVFPEWPAFQSTTTWLPLVARIDRVGAAISTIASVGTGVLVADRVLLTNRHVLVQVSRGTELLEEGQAEVRFAWEDGTFADNPPIPVVGVAMLHSKLDLALLRLKANPAAAADRFPEIDASPIEENAAVVAVGYPLEDKVRNPLFTRNMFGTTYGVLRAAPGQCTGAFSDGFYHDCTTLGGNSGSPIVSLRTGKILGLHASGGFFWKNEAVAGPAVAAFLSPQT
jgi:S1-C subfamily serine protease